MDGTKVIGADLQVGGNTTLNGDLQVTGTIQHQGITYQTTTSPEYLYCILDSQERVICGIKTDGKFYAENEI